MATSRTLDIDGLETLSIVRFDHLRIHPSPGAGVLGRDVLRGSYHGVMPMPADIGEDGPRGDLIGTGWANVYVMTARFEGSLVDLGLTGWKAIPIAIRGSNAGLDRLSLLAVIGRSGPVIGSGGVKRAGIDPLGRYLDPADWDGSDIFLPKGTSWTLVVAEAARRLAALRLKDVMLEPAGLESLPSM